MREKIKAGGHVSPYRLRKQLPEPVFGQIKQARGFRQFLLRGVEKVTAEWGVVYIAHNILKLAQGETPSIADAAAAWPREPAKDTPRQPGASVPRFKSPSRRDNADRLLGISFQMRDEPVSRWHSGCLEILDVGVEMTTGEDLEFLRLERTLVGRERFVGDRQMVALRHHE